MAHNQKSLQAKQKEMLQKASKLSASIAGKESMVGRQLLGKIRHWTDEFDGRGRAVYGQGRVLLHESAYDAIYTDGLDPLTASTVFCSMHECMQDYKPCEYDIVHFTLVHDHKGYRAVEVELAPPKACSVATKNWGNPSSRTTPSTVEDDCRASTEKIVGRALLGKVRHWESDAWGRGRVLLHESAHTQLCKDGHVLTTSTVFCSLRDCKEGYNPSEYDVVHITLVQDGRGYRAVEVEQVSNPCQQHEGEVICSYKSGGIISSRGETYKFQGAQVPHRARVSFDAVQDVWTGYWQVTNVVVLQEPLVWTTTESATRRNKTSQAAKAHEVKSKPPCPTHRPKERTTVESTVMCKLPVVDQESIAEKEPTDAASTAASSQDFAPSATGDARSQLLKLRDQLLHCGLSVDELDRKLKSLEKATAVPVGDLQGYTTVKRKHR